MSKKAALPEEMTLSGDGKKEFHRKLKRFKKQKPFTDTGVIYIGHIPHGFYEDAMRGYFSQFGKVTRVKVSRSRKELFFLCPADGMTEEGQLLMKADSGRNVNTGNAKGYGFVEFASAVVAKIVADTMNNYLMFNRLLKCQLLDPSKVHPETFRGCFRQFYPPNAHIRSIERHNKLKTPQQQKQALQRMIRRKNKSLRKLAELGISYKLPDMLTKEKEAGSDTMTEDTMPQIVTKSPAATPSPKRVKKDLTRAKSPAVTPVSTKKTKKELTPAQSSAVTPLSTKKTKKELTPVKSSIVTPLSTKKTKKELTHAKSPAVTPLSTKKTKKELTPAKSSVVTPLSTKKTKKELTPAKSYVVTPLSTKKTKKELTHAKSPAVTPLSTKKELTPAKSSVVTPLSTKKTKKELTPAESSAVTPVSTKKTKMGVKTLEKLSSIGTPVVDSPSTRTRSKRKLPSMSPTKESKPRKAMKKTK